MFFNLFSYFSLKSVGTKTYFIDCGNLKFTDNGRNSK